jgi:hypothetical protein
VTLATAALVLWAPIAVGHGPCRCLDRVLVKAGEQVRLTDAVGHQAAGVGYPAYRVVFNPRPTDFGIAPGYLASAYRADAPTTTVLSRPRRDPTRRGRFVIPSGTPAGLYMVLIWDGDEGGAHNTWEYLHVAARDESDGLGVVARQDEPHAAASPTPEEATGSAEGTPTPEEPSGSNTSTRWSLIAGIGLGSLVLGAVGGRAAGRRRGEARQ